MGAETGSWLISAVLAGCRAASGKLGCGPCWSQRFPDVCQGVFAFLFGYICGAIPFGLILTRAAGTPDLRAIGSGNIGATNVLRTGRKDLAAMTLLLDLLKGTVAVLIVAYFAPGPAMLVAALGAFLGHLFPAWLKFRGGKGVATFLGCLLGVAWQAALAFGIIWLAVAVLTRISSAAALAASALTPVVFIATGQNGAAAIFGLMAILLWVKHRANIARLAAGTESRIGTS
jgi:acyl phosphate:glycerol-3-phosphate acyltransferase